MENNTCKCEHCDCKDDAKLDAAVAESVWVDSFKLPTYQALKGDQEFDVAVIGGGITGLTAALKLKEAGKKVVVVD
jgi:heterodisulfide reductase subunit A-like polyferredoxin